MDWKTYREWYDCAVNLTEVLWRQAWTSLPKKEKANAEPGKLVILGDAPVDEEQQRIFGLGPKFCTEPSLQTSERLALARDIFMNVSEEEKEL